MILKFEGVYKEYDHEVYSSHSIGGRDFIEEVEDAGFGDKFKGKVTVAFTEKRFDGTLDIDCGSQGYSEWTPGDPAQFKIGSHNILRELERLDGKEIVLWVADEPVNVLE